MQIQYMKVKELIPYENNPRKNDKAVKPVMASIREFGFKVPILIDKSNVIIAGHTRLRAAKRLKMDEVPVIQVEDLTDDQVKAFRIADNKTSEFAEWDLGALEIELKEIKMDMMEFEVDAPEIMNTSVEDNYEMTLPTEPKYKHGDVFQLGRHRLMCGDATNLNDMQDLVGDGLVDAIITDPPYNIDYEGTAGKIMNDKQDRSDFREFLVRSFSNLNEILKQGGAFYIWHPDGRGSLDFRLACEEIGWEIRQCLIWNKSSFNLGRSDYQWKHEACIYGWKAGAKHYFIDDRTFNSVFEEGLDVTKLKLAEARELLRQLLGPNTATTVIDEKKPQRNDLHPTMKPVRLMGRILLNSTKKLEVVLDPFAGSGSTLIAAEQLGRTSYMMELDPKFVEVIIDRYEKFTGNKAEKVIKEQWINENNNN